VVDDKNAQWRHWFSLSLKLNANMVFQKRFSYLVSNNDLNMIAFEKEPLELKKHGIEIYIFS